MKLTRSITPNLLSPYFSYYLFKMFTEEELRELVTLMYENINDLVRILQNQKETIEIDWDTIEVLSLYHQMYKKINEQLDKF